MKFIYFLPFVVLKRSKSFVTILSRARKILKAETQNNLESSIGDAGLHLNEKSNIVFIIFMQKGNFVRFFFDK